MFSSRLPWSLSPNRLATLLQSKRQTGSAIIDLTGSNPTTAGFSYPIQMLSALADRRSLVYEPVPAGLFRAREAVAGYYSLRGQAVGPDRIFLTASTSESYAYLLKLLADPGDEILVPRPSYPLFEFLAAMESVRLVQYPLVYHSGWCVDFDALARSSNDRTRAVIVVNPNNPTGSFLKTGELQTLVHFCAERDLAIISDEVFSDFSFGPDPQRVTTLTGVAACLTFCLSGLSKVAGLPQMKLGWIVIGGPPGIRTKAVDRLELVADTYLSVSTPVQHAVPQFLAAGVDIQTQIATRVHANLASLRSYIGPASSCCVLDAEGGWYATLRVPRTKSEEDWALDLLDQDDTLVQPGYFYDFESEAFLVISLLTSPEEFQQGVFRLLARTQ